MKISASSILAPLIAIYLIASIYAVEEVPAIFSFMRIFRLAIIPFLLFIAVTLLPQQSKSKIRIFIGLSFPIITLLAINVFQLVALPRNIAVTHASISVRFTAVFLLYLCALLSINTLSVKRISLILLITMPIILLVGIIQYPNAIAHAGVSLGAALSNYGQLDSRSQLAGIFGSSNEDANGFITLFPLALLWVEKTQGLQKLILRYTLFTAFALALLFNGTRTALIVSLPLITFLFYSNLSIKRILYSFIPLLSIGSFILLFNDSIFEKIFGQEVSGEGTLDWRVEHVWSPVIKYTVENSPVFGFGSRGWEYICTKLDIISIVTGVPNPSHSGYVWAFASWGVLGLIAYVSFLLILLLEAFKLSQSADFDIAYHGKALFCSVTGYCIWAFISNVMFSQGWIILMSLGILIAAFKFIELSDISDDASLHNRLQASYARPQNQFNIARVDSDL